MNEKSIISEIKPNQEAIVEAVRQKRDSLYGMEGKAEEVHERILDIVKKFEEKYPNAREYYLFHVMIGSTTDRQDCPNLDFPGDDSIAKRLDNLYREYKTN